MINGAISNIFQIGDLVVHLQNQKINVLSDILDVSPKKLLFSENFSFPTNIGISKARNLVVSGTYFDDDLNSSRQFISKIKTLARKELDIISYSAINSFPAATMGHDFPIESALDFAGDELLWMTNRGIIKDIKISNDIEGFSADISITIVLKKPWEILNRIFWKFRSSIYDSLTTFAYSSTGPYITNLISWWEMNEMTDLTASLDGWWEMNERSGTRNDSTANNNHLTQSNSPVFVIGKKDFAAKFVSASSQRLYLAGSQVALEDGASNPLVDGAGNPLTVSVEAGLDYGDEDIQMSCFVNADSLTADMVIMSKWDDASDKEFLLRYNNSSDRFEFLVSNDGSTEISVLANSFGAPAINTDYYISAYHDSVGNIIAISVNNGPFDTTAHTTGVYDGSSDFTIGSLTGGGEYWNGWIDIAGIWNRILFETENHWLYNNGLGREFSQLSATTATSRVDNYGGNDLTDNATVETGFGKSLWSSKFVAANSEYLSISDNSTLSIGDNDFSVGCWVKATTLSGSAVGVISKWVTSGDQREFMITIDSSDQFAFHASGDGTVGDVVTVTATTFGPIQVGIWYFVVGWNDTTNNQIGISVNQKSDTAAHTSGIFDGTSAFEVGRYDGGNYLNGEVDRLFLYKKKLTTDNITWLYNDGNGYSLQDVINDVSVSADFNKFQSTFVDYSDIVNSPRHGGIWARRNIDNTGNSWDVIYQTALWPSFINNLSATYPSIGRNSTTIVNRVDDTYVDPTIFSAPPNSIYSMDIDPLLLGSDLQLEMIVEDDSGGQRTYNVTMDFDDLDTDLSDAGHTGILAGDILIFGNVVVKPGFVIRGTSILESAYPRFSYEGEFPGFLSTGKNSIKLVITPDSAYSPVLSSLHLFRSH